MTPRDEDDAWGRVDSDRESPQSITPVSARVIRGAAPGAARSAAPARGPVIAGISILVLLSAVCVALVYQSGAYSLKQWLPALMGVAALGVVAAIAGPAVPSTRFQKVLLALFALQTVWTAASILWASSPANAWEETNRTLLYAVAVLLTFAAVRWARGTGLKALALLITAVTAVVAIETAIFLAVSHQALDAFILGRLNRPIGYFNALASFWMIGFWLSLGMSAAPENGGERLSGGRLPRWTQPLLLAFGVLLAEMALLPQSRGALWTFFLVIPFFVILSPNRFRALVNLGIVMLPVVLFWNRITGIYAAARGGGGDFPLAVDQALEAIGYSVAIVLGIWAVTYLIERWLAPLSKRVVHIVGVVLIVLALAGVAGGLFYADHRTDGLGDYLGDRWEEVVGDRAEHDPGTSRFSALGLNGRWNQWKVAAQAFRDEPLLGIGAQNFELYHYQHRVVPMEVKQPHSQVMQVLAELGLPGIILWVAFVLGTLVYSACLRFRPLGRATQATIAAIMTAGISWFIHSSADWLWQVAANSLPAAMLFGGLIGTSDTRPDRPASSTRSPGRRLGRLRLTRPLLVVLALMVIVSAALPYLALRYCDLAASAKTLDTTAARAETAAKIDPTSVMPFVVQAHAHRFAALDAPEESQERVTEYQAEAAAWSDATLREPEYWLYYFDAAEALVAAWETALTFDPVLADELVKEARAYLAEARRLNPLSPQVTKLEKGLERRERSTD